MVELKAPSQLLDFKDKIILVTGGGIGIGAAIARRFAEAGADVVVCDIKQDSQVCTDIEGMGRKALFLQADVSDPTQVKEALSEVAHQWSPIDVLVNNAGIYPPADLLDMTPEAWDSVIDLNLKGVLLCTQYAARQMIEAHKGGSIINISSINGLCPEQGYAHYSTSKAGVIMLGSSSALELGRYGIRVNTVSPGWINRPDKGIDPDRFERWTKKAPLGRIGEPEDIADACLFLASDAARWITGVNLVVDGGMTVTHPF
jgi:NAD(P)-dependent dehydrogenase (short-subunit alcohol dehydrogenase family)